MKYVYLYICTHLSLYTCIYIAKKHEAVWDPARLGLQLIKNAQRKNKKCPQAAPGYERPRQEVFVLPWLLIVWRLVACGAAGYRVPDKHHLRWTPRKAALVPKQSRFECQKSFATYRNSASGSSFGAVRRLLRAEMRRAQNKQPAN